MHFNYEQAIKTNPELAKKKTIINPTITAQGLVYSDEPISDFDRTFVKEILVKHFLFKSSTEESLDKFLQNFLQIEVKAGYPLFKTGDLGTLFYIIFKGEIEIIVDGKNKRTKILKEGSTFGELALLQKSKRSASAISFSDAILFYVDGNLLRTIIGDLNKAETKERNYFVSLIPLFSGLNDLNIHKLSSQMVKLINNLGEKIIYEDNISESLYILKEGTLGVQIDGKLIRKINPKGYFGEVSLVFDIRSTSSIIVLSDQSICYQIPRTMLLDCLGQDYKHIILKFLLKDTFNKSSLLSPFVTEKYFNRIYDKFEAKIFTENEVVLPKDTSKDGVILIAAVGKVINSRTEELVLERGIIYGDDYNSTSNQIVNDDLIATTDTIILMSNWKYITKDIDSTKSPLEIINLFKKLNLLKKVEIFSWFNENKKLSLSQKMQEEQYSNGDFVFKTGSVGDKLYIINEGTVKIEKDGKLIRNLDHGQCFGELSLLLNKDHTANVIVESDKLHLYTLNKKDFISVIDKEMQTILLHNISLLDTFNLNLSNFYFYRILGNGKFGVVALVHNKTNLYAVKIVKKSTLEKQKVLINYFVNEKKILLSLNHPFVVKLVKTLKSKTHIYYIQEFVQGLVFSKYLNNRVESEIYNSEVLKFYIANILITVDYIHSKSVCHRDLKPENIMIDEKGYLKLLDFGTSIILKDHTFTLTGTPHYIAPEVILGKGYSFSCDFWSVGVIAYEIFFNYYPFGNNANDPMEVYREVVTMKPSYEDKFEVSISQSTKNAVVGLIDNLLQKHTVKRACSLSILKELPLFIDFDFNDITDFSIKPRFIPPINFEVNKILHKKDELLTNSLDKIYKIVPQDTLSSIDDESCNDYDKNWEDRF